MEGLDDLFGGRCQLELFYVNHAQHADSPTAVVQVAKWTPRLLLEPLFKALEVEYVATIELSLADQRQLGSQIACIGFGSILSQSILKRLAIFSLR